MKDFWDLLEPFVVHGAGADAGFKSMEDCCNVYQLPLRELVRMAGPCECGIVKHVTCPDRMYAMSYVNGRKTNIFKIWISLFYRKHLVIVVQTGTSILLGTSDRSMTSCMKVVILIQFCRIRLEKVLFAYWQDVGFTGSLFCHDSCRGLGNSQSQAGIAIGQPWSFFNIHLFPCFCETTV